MTGGRARRRIGRDTVVAALVALGEVLSSAGSEHTFGDAIFHGIVIQIWHLFEYTYTRSSQIVHGRYDRVGNDTEIVLWMTAANFHGRPKPN